MSTPCHLVVYCCLSLRKTRNYTYGNHNMPIKQSVCIPILPQDAMPQEELLAEIVAIGPKEPS